MITPAAFFYAHGWAVCSECMDAQDAYKEVGGRKRMERVFERRCPWMGGRALKDGESENGFTQNKLEARI